MINICAKFDQNSKGTKKIFLVRIVHRIRMLIVCMEELILSINDV